MRRNVLESMASPFDGRTTRSRLPWLHPPLALCRDGALLEDHLRYTLLRLVAPWAVLVLTLSACSSHADSRQPSGAAEKAPSIDDPDGLPSAPVDVAGSVYYLFTGGFAGGGKDLRFRPKPDGSACPAQDSYNDVREGSAVTISSGTGDTLATVALGKPVTRVMTRHSEAERDERAALIDAIYNLRIARTWNEVKIERLSMAQAKQTLNDIKHPKQWDFEGAKWVAVWCELSFTAGEVPAADTYVVEVGERPAVVVSHESAATDADAFSLYLE